jgi:hypothetical protein
MRFLSRVLIAAFLVSLASVGCRRAAPEVDLIPSVPPGAPNNNTGFCINNEKIGVVVKNLGRVSVNDVEVKVTFSFRGTAQTPPPLTVSVPAAGAPSSLLEFAIPAGCFDSDCNFSITVDPDAKTPDTNRLNNTVNGVCIG